MASPIAAIRNSRNEEDRTFLRLLSGISEDGRATQDMNSTPPSSSDWKTSVPARNSTERYPKMLTSLSNMDVYRNSIVVVPWVVRAFRGMCDNSFWVATVERLRKIKAPQGRNNISPGRKPWVTGEKLMSPFRDGTVLTHPLQARVKTAQTQVPAFFSCPWTQASRGRVRTSVVPTGLGSTSDLTQHSACGSVLG